MTIAKYLVRSYLRAFLGIFAAILVIFLVSDFVDRSKSYTGPNWVRDVAELYWFKALVTLHQLAPAALLLAAGATLSTFRKRGELTALRALAFRPAHIYVPLLVVAVGVSALGVGFDEWVVTHAGRRVDEIATLRFKRWGDWGRFFIPRQWFRREHRVFHLRGGDAQQGFVDVTVLELTPDFQLAGRLDADRMEHVAENRWNLVNLRERRFSDEGSTIQTWSEVERDLGAPASAFRIRAGRPEQMRLTQLLEQIEAREAVGLSTALYRLALHNRFAYPLAGVPAALLAIALAVRPSRKGHLTAALVEGLGIAVGFWGMMVVAKALAMGGSVSPVLAAWGPFASLSLAALGMLWRQEGRVGGRG